MDKCIYCNSTDLTRNIELGLNAEVNRFGLKYKGRLAVRNVEPVVADMCNACGSITRFHIQNKDRKWIVSKNKS